MSVTLFSDAPKWTSVEAKALRDFLTSDTGTKMLTLCQLNTPVLFDGSHVNETLVRSGEHKGYEDALAFLTSLVHTEPEQEQPEENYPSLDDDTKWGDGKNPTLPPTKN